MSAAAEGTLRLRNRASRRLSQSPSGIQRRESLLSNRLSRFSKSLGYVQTLIRIIVVNICLLCDYCLLIAHVLSLFPCVWCGTHTSCRTIPSLLFETTSSESISPKLRRCKSEEVLSSWDHFSGKYYCFLFNVILIFCARVSVYFLCPHTSYRTPNPMLLLFLLLWLVIHIDTSSLLLHFLCYCYNSYVVR